MELTDKQKMLFKFVKEKHKGQVRKYTGEPYHNHLFEVAEIVNKYEKGCIEIALCHDLFEDTDCDFTMLHKKMVEIGYSREKAYDTCTYVNELTDKFTKEDYPHLNRRKRKIEEAKRLGNISFKAQSVKYADLISNTSSIVEHDKDFAKVYLKEKRMILEFIEMGNGALFKICLEKCLIAQSELNCA